jgi:hypothetical protein
MLANLTVGAVTTGPLDVTSINIFIIGKILIKQWGGEEVVQREMNV